MHHNLIHCSEICLQTTPGICLATAPSHTPESMHTHMHPKTHRHTQHRKALLSNMLAGAVKQGRSAVCELTNATSRASTHPLRIHPLPSSTKPSSWTTHATCQPMTHHGHHLAQVLHQLSKRHESHRYPKLYRHTIRHAITTKLAVSASLRCATDRSEHTQQIACG